MADLLDLEEDTDLLPEGAAPDTERLTPVRVSDGPILSCFARLAELDAYTSMLQAAASILRAPRRRLLQTPQL